MFGLGYQEILVILVIALLVFGPTKLPEIGRQVGGMLREMRKMTGDVQRAFDLDGTGSHDRYDSRYDHDYKSTPRIERDEIAADDEIHDAEPTNVPALTYKSTTPVEFDELTEDDKPSEEESSPEEVRETKPVSDSVSPKETKETDSKEP
jgi:Tat protein translocase TatB subunit